MTARDRGASGLWNRVRHIGQRFRRVAAEQRLARTASERIRSRLLALPYRLIRSRVLALTYGRLALVLAPAYRRWALRRVTFVGVTGSAGKTTTKELIAAVLATSFRGRKTPGNYNLAFHVAHAVLKARPWDDFFVAEIAAAIRGWRIPLEGQLRWMRPRIGVVTTIGLEHIGAFPSLDAIAAEKGKLVAMLPPDGVAVLNADDPRVLAMQAARPGGHVVTYGTAADASVRAEDVRSAWPDRLSFTVVHAGRSYPVRTELCGTHLVPCVLAALAVGVAMGVPLARAVEAVQAVRPFPGRMSPATSPGGVTFIRDDAKAPLWSLPLAFQFMKDARAARKIIIVGSISDYTGSSGRKYAAVARQALDAADVVLFVGPNAAKSLRAKAHPRGDALHAASSLDVARQHLERILRAGDLVLLKGSQADRLDRLADARTAPGEAPATRDDPGPVMGEAAGSRVRVVVGLGNPGEAYESTPHNVGYRALDLLVESLGGAFAPDDEALVARIELPGGSTCYLVKASIPVNASGPVVLRLAQRVGAGPESCIVVHDDIDLPLGAIRTRMSGSDGGHRGVRSVLQAFQSDAVRRVKIGVGRPRQPGAAARHVLGRFEPAERAVIDRACGEAVVRVRELAGIAAAAQERPGR